MASEATASLDVSIRLDEFRQLRPGWLHGDGLAPSATGLDWLSNAFAEHYPADLPSPRLYPTAEGGVQAEWTLNSREISLEIDLASRHARWHVLNMETSKDQSRSIDLGRDYDWGWIVGQCDGSAEV